MSRKRKLELYEHDDDLCARGCGRGCSRNTYTHGWTDAEAYLRPQFQAKVRALTRRIRLAARRLRTPNYPLDEVLWTLDLRKPLSRRTKRAR